MVTTCLNRQPGVETEYPNRAEPAQIWKARHFIHENLDGELSLRKVADFVNISANHLSEKFKQVTGLNFVDYIARVAFRKSDPTFAGSTTEDQRDRVCRRFSVAVAVQSRLQEILREISNRIPRCVAHPMRNGNGSTANLMKLTRNFVRKSA